jgi:CubicO group peptidase (beta-lactamase class C family)
MSLAIVKDGKVVYAKGLGLKDFENKVPVTADTQFAIGSATKAFTALTVLMAQDAGKLSLDDHPRKLLPYFKMRDSETDAKITIRDLLSHSSGLNRTDLAMVTGRLNRSELIQVAAQAKPTAKLREKWQYQNLMFTAAGEIAAAAEKQPWEKLVPERVLKPLGMANSTMSIAEMEKAKDRSFGYTYNFDTKETTKLPYREIVEVAPAGSINSSANDMARWLQFVLSGGKAPDGKRLVSEASFAEWTKPQMNITPDGKVSYGLGWFIQDWNGLKVVQHGGNIDGFNSMVAMVPEKNVGFVMLTNVSASPLGTELMPIVWQNLIGQPEGSNNKVPAELAAQVTGKYRLEAAGIDLEVKSENGGLLLVVPGQPQYPLQQTTGREFKMQGAPAGFAVRFDPADGAASSMYLQQPNANFTLPKLNADGSVMKLASAQPQKETAKAEPPIAVDELMAKTIEAAGGEANIRKIKSRVSTFEMDMENQGVQGTGISYAKAPNKSATETTMTALGKKIALVWEYFDGTTGEQATTFTQSDKYTGKRLEDVKIGSDFYGALDWKSRYKKVDVTKIAKVGDEDAYVVVFEPEAGSRYTDYYSTKTFLLLKREGIIPSSTGGPSLPYTVTYSDYRDVDGVRVPFLSVNSSISNGNIVTKITSVKHNQEVDDSIFKPRTLKL